MRVSGKHSQKLLLVRLKVLMLSQNVRKWCGVPHWESQPRYTNELLVQPCRTRKSLNAPLTTMWQRERKPLRSTLGGEAENGDKTWEMLVGP